MSIKNLVSISVLTLAIAFAWGMDSEAKPTDLISNDCKQVYNMNIIGHPGDYNGNCGNGHRIFVNRGANHDHILVEEDGQWHVEDCNATDAGGGILHSDSPGDYIVTIDVTGKPGGEFTIICADIGGTVAMHEHTGAEECIIEDFSISKQNGRSRFAILPSAIFDETGEGVLWSVETNNNFRKAGIRVWECPE